MNSEAIHVGIIGAGANTRRRHIPGLQAIDGVEIVSVCNRSRQSSQQVADEFGISRVHDHWRDLVEDPDVDAVVIGTWPYLHCAATLAALEADKHVLCEARMAMNLDEALLMRDEAQANPHLVAQIVPSPLTLAVDRAIIRLIAEGQIGELLAVDLRDGTAFLDPDAPLHWRNDIDKSGLNILTLGIWYEALLRWIGPATRVTALASTCVKTRTDDEGRRRAIQIPDHVDVLCEMACGAQARLQFSAVTGLHPQRGALLFGSDGTIWTDGQAIHLGSRRDDALEPIEIPDAERGAWRVEEEFVAAIRGEEEIKLTTFDDGVKYMAFTQAVHDSLQTGRAVSTEIG